MTTQTAIIITQDYGASLSTPTLRHHLTDTLIVAADSANEVTADSGRYALVFTESAVHAAGWYGLRAFVSGAPINRFVYFTGVDGETAIAVTDLPSGLPLTGQVIVTRPVGDDTPITFSFPVASATLTGTRRLNNAGSTTALSGALSFLRTSGAKHLYSLAYNAADRPSDDGVVEYVFTDGTLSRTVVLKAVTAALDSASRAAVADAVLTESILDHRNVAHSLAKYIYQIRQANLTVDGTVSSAITPTTLTFSSNVAATTSAYAHAVLLFTTGALAGENSPIISYNATNGVFLLEEALTAAPSNGDEFVVIAGSHVHSVADIQSGLATAAAMAKVEAVVAGTVTGAGTATEVFVGPSATVTVTVDSSGNRSNVSVT
jgi:hypothetical protein